MFRVIDLTPNQLSNYDTNDIYDDIEMLMEEEGSVAYYLQQVKQDNNVRWEKIESNINLDKYDEVILKLSTEWNVYGLKTLKDTTYTIFSASLKSKEREIETKSEANNGAVEELMYIVKQFDEYIRRVHEQNMDVLKSYLPASRQGWWVEENPYAQLISDIGKMFHDLATALSLILEEIKGTEKLHPFKDVVNELRANFARVDIYHSGSVINLQASTGHTVKINTGEERIQGHIGDHAPIPDLDVKYKRSINRNKGKMKEMIEIIARIIEQEQIIRDQIVDIDYYISSLYSEANTDDPEVLLQMIESDEDEYRNLKGYYEQVQMRIEKINSAWDIMMQDVLELQRFLAEPVNIEYDHWLLTLPASSFADLFKELQLLNLF